VRLAAVTDVAMAKEGRGAKPRFLFRQAFGILIEGQGSAGGAEAYMRVLPPIKPRGCVSGENFGCR